MISLVFNISFILKSPLISYLTLIKLLLILVIFYRLAHQNYSNYILFFVLIYMYSANTKVDTIIFLNSFGLFVLYNMFLKKLRGITSLNIAFIKKQIFNCKFVDT